MIKENASAPERPEDVLGKLDALTGLEAVKAELHRVAEAAGRIKTEGPDGPSGESVPTCMVFTGNPGTGKTTAARLTGRLYSALGLLPADRLIETNRAGLVGAYVGQTAARMRETFESALGGVLFIDEADALADAAALEAVDTLARELEGRRGGLLVILAGCPDGMEDLLERNPGLRRRVDKTIEFPDFGPETLTAILESEAEKRSYVLSREAKDLCRRVFAYRRSQVRPAAFGNGHEAVSLFMAMTENQSQRLRKQADPTREALMTLTAEDVPPKLTEGLSMRTAEEILAELEGLTGLERVKEEVRRLAGLARVNERRLREGFPVMPVSMRLIFSGDPGTGKTTVARLLGELYAALGVLPGGQLIETNRAGLVGPYVGQTAARTKEVFESALGGVLFVDEACALAEGSGFNSGMEALRALIVEMEEHREDVLVIFADSPERMEEFLRVDPGLSRRLGRRFDFEGYTPEELCAIMDRELEKHAYVMTADARARARERVEAARNEDPRNFGNGRFVRSLASELIAAQSGRVAALAESGADLSDRDLSEITAEDFRDL